MKTYRERIPLLANPVARTLFEIMEEKKTNLALACDETKAETILKLADTLGPKLAVLKTHIDIVEDFTPVFTEKLRALATRHRFLLFEDRKFGDIGNTAKMQYTGGMYRIASWADIVNASALPGPGLIEGLAEGAEERADGNPRALLLWAQITAKGSLADEKYTHAAIHMARTYPEFVAGFIGNGGDTNELGALRTAAGDTFVIMTPGVHLSRGGDSLGQRYTTPEEIIRAGSDVLIVGRGIYSSQDQVATAETYRAAGWNAYQECTRTA